MINIKYRISPALFNSSFCRSKYINLEQWCEQNRPWQSQLYPIPYHHNARSFQYLKGIKYIADYSKNFSERLPVWLRDKIEGCIAASKRPRAAHEIDVRPPLLTLICVSFSGFLISRCDFTMLIIFVSADVIAKLYGPGGSVINSLISTDLAPLLDNGSCQSWDIRERSHRINDELVSSNYGRLPFHHVILTVTGITITAPRSSSSIAHRFYF